MNDNFLEKCDTIINDAREILKLYIELGEHNNDFISKYNRQIVFGIEEGLPEEFIYRIQDNIQLQEKAVEDFKNIISFVESEKETLLNYKEDVERLKDYYR